MLDTEKNKNSKKTKVQNKAHQKTTNMACPKKCPECGEACAGGLHLGGQHACSNGHSW